MQDKVKEALAVLRSTGVRIPRSFTKRLHKKAAYVPNREDIKAFKEAVGRLSGGGATRHGAIRQRQAGFLFAGDIPGACQERPTCAQEIVTEVATR